MNFYHYYWHGLEYLIITLFLFIFNYIFTEMTFQLETLFLPLGVSNIPVSLPPAFSAASHGGAPEAPVPGYSLPGNGAPSLGSSAAVAPSGPGGAGRNLNVQVVLSPGGTAPSGPGQGLLNTDIQVST